MRYSKSVGPLLPRALQLPPPVKREGVGLGRLQDPWQPQPQPQPPVPNSGTAPATLGRARSRREATPRPRRSEDAEEGAPGTSLPRGGA